MKYLSLKKIKKNIVSPSISVKKAIEILSSTGLRILIVVDRKKNYLGTLTDGDLRRSILKKIRLADKINSIVNYNSIYIDEKNSSKNLKKLMLDNSIVALPILKNQKIFKLLVFSNAKSVPNLQKNNVVIMSGGRGERLMPLTKNVPKAILKYRGKALITYVIENCIKSGFSSFIISINYLGQKIINFIKKSNFKKIKIQFLMENEPMGTIGSLSLINKITKNFLVINCDIITKLNINNFLQFHLNQNALMTIGVKKLSYTRPYGEIKFKNNTLLQINEKPKDFININSGIYAFKREILPIIKKKKFKDIIQLINFLQKKKLKFQHIILKKIWLMLVKNNISKN